MRDHINEAYELAWETVHKTYRTVDLHDPDSAGYRLFIDILVKTFTTIRNERS